MPSVLFVCTANRFRSPLAAAVFRKTLEEKGMHDSWQVSSAGTWATAGQPVLPQVEQAARLLNLDLSGHRSVQLDGQLLLENDLILVMQAGQREALLCEFPGCEAAIHLFSEAAEGRSYDFPDAAGSSQEVAELVMELDSLIRSGFPSICTLAARLHDENCGSRL